METEKSAYITQIEVTDFLEKGQNLYLPLNKDVTILAGDNGTGKTKLLQLINAAANIRELPEYLAGFFSKVTFFCGNREKVNYEAGYTGCCPIRAKFIGSCDVLRDFSDDRFRKFDDDSIDGPLNIFLDIVNNILGTQGIKIEIRFENYLYTTKNGKRLHESDLSDGQRRILLILSKAIKASIYDSSLLLIDTPETFLFVSQQRTIMDNIRKINPNVQLLITSNSPQLISSVGRSRLVLMNEILSKAKC